MPLGRVTTEVLTDCLFRSWGQSSFWLCSRVTVIFCDGEMDFSDSEMHWAGGRKYSNFYSVFVCLFVFCFLYFFWGGELCLWHMEVPRLGVKLEPQRPATPQPQQCGIWATPGTYTTAHSKAGTLTNGVRPGIEPASSWILVGFVNRWAMKGTPPNFDLGLSALKN